MSLKNMDGRWGNLFSSMALLTSLAEALDWDDDLARDLFKYWSVHYSDFFKYEKTISVHIMISYLPDDKKHLEDNLINWLQMNFNPITSNTKQEIN